jgi:hypothetical protein
VTDAERELLVMTAELLLRCKFWHDADEINHFRDLITRVKEGRP